MHRLVCWALLVVMSVVEALAFPSEGFGAVVDGLRTAIASFFLGRAVQQWSWKRFLSRTLWAEERKAQVAQRADLEATLARWSDTWREN